MDVVNTEVHAPVSEQEYERVRQRVPVPYVYNGCLAWYNALLIPRVTQACNTVNWNIC